MKGFTFKVAGKSLEILFYGEVGDSYDGITAKQFSEELNRFTNVGNILIRMNSIGGDAYQGAAIYNTLTRHKAHVTVEVDGAALSAASLVAMAGDTIRMSENAFMMIHNPWGVMAGGAKDFRDYADILDGLSESYAKTYSDRTAIDVSKISKMMEDETWMSASEAVSLNFAHELLPNKKIAACYVPQGRFRNTPANLLAKPTVDIGVYRKKVSVMSGNKA